jgi:hypothetical protein
VVCRNDQISYTSKCLYIFLYVPKPKSINANVVFEDKVVNCLLDTFDISCSIKSMNLTDVKFM